MAIRKTENPMHEPVLCFVLSAKLSVQNSIQTNGKQAVELKRKYLEKKI